MTEGKGDSLKALFEQQVKQVSFKRHIGFAGAVTIGVGALMGAGIYVLIGISAGYAGPAVIFSYLLCGLMAFLTTLLFAEISRIIPRSGGGYVYSYETLGNLGGFAAGWFLALGSMFACGMYAIGFAQYFASILPVDIPAFATRFIAIAIVMVLAYFNTRPQKGNNRLQFWFTWGNVGILLLLVFAALLLGEPSLSHNKPVFPKGLKGMLSAISLIYISFFGYQLIANNADEIIEPERTVPRAMKWSLIIALMMYLLVTAAALLVVPWQQLAASDAPLVLVAEKCFGGKGWLVISAGGVLASLGALNSTLVSQSRQIFVMGKHRFFPDWIARMSHKTQTPNIALVTGATGVAMALLFFNLEFIAKSANFCLLASMLPVSLALRVIYNRKPETRPINRFMFFIPEIALVTNILLMLTLDIVSLAFGQQLIIAGAVIYYFYSRKRVKRARTGINIDLAPSRSFKLLSGNRILVPMANPNTQKALFLISHALLAKKKGEIIVLSVKDVPPGTDFYEALKDATDSLAVIENAMKYARQTGTTIRPVIHASRNIATGIVNAAEEENADLIVMGYADHIKGKSNIMDKVLQFAHRDMLFLKLRQQAEDFNPKKILVVLRKKSNMELALLCATSLAERFGARLFIVRILKTGFTKKQKQDADQMIADAIEQLNSIALYDASIYVTDHPAEYLIEMTRDYDLLIIGKTRERIIGKNPEDSVAYRVVENAACSAILVKQVEPFKKFISRI